MFALTMANMKQNMVPSSKSVKPERQKTMAPKWHYCHYCHHRVLFVCEILRYGTNIIIFLCEILRYGTHIIFLCEILRYGTHIIIFLCEYYDMITISYNNSVFTWFGRFQTQYRWRCRWIHLSADTNLYINGDINKLQYTPMRSEKSNPMGRKIF
jgi:hypothetical protein